MPGSLSHGFDEKSSSFERELVWAYVWALPYLEVASGSIPLFLITSEARAEARNSISRLEASISPEPATPDRSREVTVDCEIVPLKHVADHAGGNNSVPGRGILSSPHTDRRPSEVRSTICVLSRQPGA